MSDTPIDRGLKNRVTTRHPEHLDELIGQFKEDYNETIESTPMDDEHKDVFRLENDSDARRRLIDMGLSLWQSNDTPFGFVFDFDQGEDEDLEPACEGCGEDDPTKFRVGADVDGDELNFTKARCVSCGEVQTLDDLLEEPQFSF